MSLFKPFFLALPLALGWGTAAAQTARDLTDISLELYQQANSPRALERMRQDLVNAPEAYLVAIDQPGTLVLASLRRLRVPALKYNVALHLLEARDSTGSHVWPPGSLAGFEVGRGSDARRFRSYPVRVGSTRTEFVEVLTADNSPLVLGLLHSYVHQDAELDPVLRTVKRKEVTEIQQVVVAGAGPGPREPLRELPLNQRAIARLFGSRAAEVDAFATKENLRYTDLAQVLRLVEYYNRPASK